MSKFQIYYPVKPLHINQGYGLAATDPKRLAFYESLGLVAHNGDDLRAYHGQPIYAAHDGNAFFEIDDKGGHGVVIRTDRPYDYQGTDDAYYKTIYWHLCDGVKEPQFASPITFTDMNGQGQPVKAGDLIGYADNTGASDGDHCHFGAKPQALNEANGIWYNLAQNNGELGAIDPAPLWNGLYAEDIALTRKSVEVASEAVAVIMNSDASPRQKSGWLQIIANFLKSLFS